jgi:hypothetical protein
MVVLTMKISLCARVVTVLAQHVTEVPLKIVLGVEMVTSFPQQPVLDVIQNVLNAMVHRTLNAHSATQDFTLIRPPVVPHVLKGNTIKTEDAHRA